MAAASMAAVLSSSGQALPSCSRDERKCGEILARKRAVIWMLQQIYLQAFWMYFLVQLLLGC